MSLLIDIDKQVRSSGDITKTYDSQDLSPSDFVSMISELANSYLLQNVIIPVGDFDTVSKSPLGVVLESTSNPFVSCANRQFTITGSPRIVKLAEQIIRSYMVYESIDNSSIERILAEQDTLNPLLWDGDTLLPEVKSALMELAVAFFESTDLPDLIVDDITITGSNATYHYTNMSDIDLHLLVNVKEMEDVYGALLGPYADSQRKLWKVNHEVVIRDIPVEVYIQDINEEHHSTGIYSIVSDSWLSTPTPNDIPDINENNIRLKADRYIEQIDQAISDQDPEAMAELADKITASRRAGLSKSGEWNPENLVFKILRNEKYIERLTNARHKATDMELSIEEEEEDKDDPWSDIGYTKSKSAKPNASAKKERVNLNVPYSHRDSAKRFGCRYDPGIRKWYVIIDPKQLHTIPSSWR